MRDLASGIITKATNRSKFSRIKAGGIKDMNIYLSKV